MDRMEFYIYFLSPMRKWKLRGANWYKSNFWGEIEISYKSKLAN